MVPSSVTAASLLDAPSVESDRRTANDVHLHVVTAGAEDGPLVVLLHGFPEFWYCWREYVEPLVDAGYRVLVPDQRGYNLSEKPDGVRSYAVTELVADVAALIDSEGRESAHVVGHDWGASVAWELALRRPERLDRLGIVNVPHPTVFRRAITTDHRQLRRSWYVFYFQLPRLPEFGSRYDDFRALERAMRGRAAPGAFTDEDMERYRAAWRRQGALAAMIDWYRAAARHYGPPPRKRVTAPALVVWGDRDAALLPELAPKSLRYCEDGRLERFPDATHWVHHERPDAVSELLCQHLAGG